MTERYVSKCSTCGDTDIKEGSAPRERQCQTCQTWAAYEPVEVKELVPHDTLPAGFTVSDRDTLVQERFGEFISSLANEVGESPVGAMCAVCWQREEAVSIAVTIAQSPKPVMMKLIDLMTKKFIAGASRIKAVINTQKNEVATH